MWTLADLRIKKVTAFPFSEFCFEEHLVDGVLVDGIPPRRSPVPEETLHRRGVAWIPEFRVQIVPDEVEES